MSNYLQIEDHEQGLLDFVSEPEQDEREIPQMEPESIFEVMQNIKELCSMVLNPCR